MEKKEETSSLMHSFKEKVVKPASLPVSNIIVVLVIIALFGVGTGYVLSKVLSKSNNGSIVSTLGSSPKGSIFGSGDTSVFKDTAEGVLKEGGIEGEGQYHLERPGGVSQNVYLTSSLVDLSQFMNKKIKVWGQTQKAQSAGWLMDVGKVEVL